MYRYKTVPFAQFPKLMLLFHYDILNMIQVLKRYEADRMVVCLFIQHLSFTVSLTNVFDTVIYCIKNTPTN